MNTLTSFDPFNKNLEEILPDDLAILLDVAEGWYIEYKSQVVTAKSIAKSISAFANHYGGWIFYGIQQASDGSNKAGGFPGLDQSDVALLIDRIRNAVKDLINPSPYYDYRILTGPSSEIGLLSNKSVVMVMVPSGSNAPYIHTEGRIYRRIADASDPKTETDRFILDQLWQRGKESQEKLASFLQAELILSGQENHVSYLDLFLLPDPLGAAQQVSKLTFTQFVEQMTDSDSPGLRISYDNFYPMSDGFIARAVNMNDPYNLVSTWRHYKNGSSVVSIPFPSISIDEIHPDGWLHGYNYEDAFIKLLAKSKHRYSYLLDVNLLIQLTMSTINQQRLLLNRGGIKGPLYAKAALHNIWRRIPYLDTVQYIQLITTYGFPLIQFEKEFAPPGASFDSLVLLPGDIDADKDNDPISRDAGDAFYILHHVLSALGIAIDAVIPHENSEFEWWAASERALNVVMQHRQKNF
jgi:hypothetical protein